MQEAKNAMKLHRLTRMGSGEDIQRRTLMGGALAALLSSRAAAQGVSVPHDPFILLLQGIYQGGPPVPSANGNGPNLGLSLTKVTIDDGSFSRTLIYPVFGIAGSPNEPIGNFYVQFSGNLCAYDLPGGAILMQFKDGKGAAVQRNFTFATIIPDKVGGYYLKGTFELTILEATGVYSSFAGGHNHMVDTLHQLSDGNYDESCFCHISGKDR
jgi:opacity protein-like surface antigen